MKAKFATLIVEDTIAYQEIYSRAVERQGGTPVVVATYEAAADAIARRLFGVGIIDVRLSEQDQTNVDGLKVIEFFRRMGDATSLVVITGYGSFRVARDAFQQYNVFAGLEKAEGLAKIEETVAGGYRDFLNKKVKERLHYGRILKEPGLEVEIWEYRVLQTFLPSDGAGGLYRFWHALLRDQVPLIPHRKFQGCAVPEGAKTISGVFWSRAQADAVLVAFGQQEAMAAFEGEPFQAPMSESPLDWKSIRVGSVIHRISSSGFRGVVRLIEDCDFSEFLTSEEA